METIFDRIAGLVSQGEDFVLATIFSRTGSAPRTTGARMVIRQDGSILGTIGGGLLEASVQRVAPDLFRQRATLVMEFSLTGQDASQLEMICGGEVAVLMEFIDAENPQEAAFWPALAAGGVTRGQHRKSWLVTALPSAPGSLTGRAVALETHAEGEWGVEVSAAAGAPLGLGADELAALLQGPGAAGSHYPSLAVEGERQWLVEPLDVAGTVVLFGGGHISQQLAPLAARVGFRTWVVDDRAEFASRSRFPEADQIVKVDSFEQALEGLKIGADGYLVIVTRGHLHDKTVLAQALRTDAKYIGMIGSIRKRNAIYEALRAEGFTEADLERVHSPIGLKIGAETPEEIAVSIVGELIACRAGRGGR